MVQFFVDRDDTIMAANTIAGNTLMIITRTFEVVVLTDHVTVSAVTCGRQVCRVFARADDTIVALPAITSDPRVREDGTRKTASVMAIGTVLIGRCSWDMRRCFTNTDQAIMTVNTGKWWCVNTQVVIKETGCEGSCGMTGITLQIGWHVMS